MYASAKKVGSVGIVFGCVFMMGGLGCFTPVTTDDASDSLESAPDEEAASPGDLAAPEEGLDEIQLQREEIDVRLQSSAAEGEGEADPEALVAVGDETSNATVMCYSTSGSSFGDQFVCNTLWGKLKAYCGLSGVAQYGVCDCSCNSLTKWCSCSTYVCCNP